MSEEEDDDNKNEVHEEDQSSEISDGYCTFAATGPYPAFQPFLVCRTCSVSTTAAADDSTNNLEEQEEQQQLECVCVSCANTCHSKHDIEYMGVGPCYCDCAAAAARVSNSSSNNNSSSTASRCLIKMRSEERAKNLGLSVKPILFDTDKIHPSFLSSSAKGDDEMSSFPYVWDVYSIPHLTTNQDTCDRLILQAKELIRHTRDTLWVPANAQKHQNNDSRCELEQLAHAICTLHLERYKLLQKNADYFTNNSNEDAVDDCFDNAGAEWWVQVKKVSTVKTSLAGEEQKEQQQEVGRPNVTALAEEAVDLHYDKDEVMAEEFSLGSFPSLSTVTYLTGSCTTSSSAAAVEAAPTLVFPHTYNCNQENPIPSMLVSHPRRGKHLVFDGRLLHGAPSNTALRRQEEEKGAASSSLLPTAPHQDNKQVLASNSESTHKEEEEDCCYRVTFLVNLWITGPPVGVHELGPQIRMAIMERTENATGTILGKLDNSCSLDLEKYQNVVKIALNNHEEKDLPLHLRNRIKLPFVSKGATWIDDDKNDDDDDNENEENLVLLTFPPPPHEQDTVMIEFGPGLEAYLDSSLKSRFKQIANTPPSHCLTPFEYEASPWCRLVREQLTKAQIRPCPRQTSFLEGAHGAESRFRPQAMQLLQRAYETDDLTFPLLVDYTDIDASKTTRDRNK